MVHEKIAAPVDGTIRLAHLSSELGLVEAVVDLPEPTYEAFRSMPAAIRLADGTMLAKAGWTTESSFGAVVTYRSDWPLRLTAEVVG